MPLAKDLLHPSPEEEKRKHKKKRLVQSPSSYFMDVKCPGCYKITTVFSHAQTVVLCVGCSTVLCQPTGGKARLTEGCSFRRKQHKGTLNQDEWETISINTFWIKKKKKERNSTILVLHQTPRVM
ncbi:40S ribosomal protein S27-like [Papio anubis]|uniref:40S ribosomal protein S27-like n=1 Tax=Papio anubis TaxID=9555 RepID=UPI0012AD8DD6|nr:40S ribosomal protein S27-like [Papio anubis]